MGVQRKRVNEYMHRLNVAGLGDRRERMNPLLRQFLDNKRPTATKERSDGTSERFCILRVAPVPDWFERARLTVLPLGSFVPARVRTVVADGGWQPALPRCQDMSVADHRRQPRRSIRSQFHARVGAAAKECGSEYVVLTAKHHDGYAMFQTARSAFSVEHSAFRRDIVREFVEDFQMWDCALACISR